MDIDPEDEPFYPHSWFSPASGDYDYDHPVMKTYFAAHFLNFEGFNRLKLSTNLGTAGLLSILLYVGLAVISVSIGIGAYYLPADSFWQSLCIEIAAGFAVFALFPVVFALARKQQRYTYSVIVFLALTLGAIGYNSSGVSQSYFIESCVALVLLILLDVGCNYLLGLFKKMRKDAEEALAEFEREVEEAKEALSPIYGFALGGGTVQETIQYELVVRHNEICKILSSDEPFHDKDVISVISRVNDLKINDSMAYATARAYADRDIDSSSED